MSRAATQDSDSLNEPRTIYAHSLPGEPQSQWETLEAHADHVARLARTFAAAFGAADWGELLSLARFAEPLAKFSGFAARSGPGTLLGN